MKYFIALIFALGAASAGALPMDKYPETYAEAQRLARQTPLVEDPRPVKPTPPGTINMETLKEVAPATAALLDDIHSAPAKKPAVRISEPNEPVKLTGFEKALANAFGGIAGGAILWGCFALYGFFKRNR